MRKKQFDGSEKAWILKANLCVFKVTVSEKNTKSVGYTSANPFYGFIEVAQHHVAGAVGTARCNSQRLENSACWGRLRAFSSRSARGASTPGRRIRFCPFCCPCGFVLRRWLRLRSLLHDQMPEKICRERAALRLFRRLWGIRRRIEQRCGGAVGFQS